MSNSGSMFEKRLEIFETRFFVTTHMPLRASSMIGPVAGHAERGIDLRQQITVRVRVCIELNRASEALSALQCSSHANLNLQYYSHQ